MKKKRRKIVNMNRFLFMILLLLICSALILYGISTSLNNKSGENNDTETPNEVSSDDLLEQEPEPPEDINVTMSVIGDIMCHNSQYKDAYVKENDTYDFSYVFPEVQKYIQVADIAVGNLETTFAGKEVGYSNYPTFNTPEQLAYNLKTLGLDILSTANNHSLDKRFNGLVSTLDFLDDAGISHTGTYRTAEEQNQILIQNVKGISMAFLSFTYGTNGIPVPSGKEFCVNLIDKDLISKQITLAKEQNPDMICVFMHWGNEYETKQNKQQEELADFLFQNGVDVILGGHSHVLQPYEKRQITLEDGTVKDGFVIYSLGNFVSGQTQKNTRDSAILTLSITKNGETGKISIDEATYVPIYMYRSTSGSVQRYKLLDIEANIANYENGTDTSIGKTTYNTLKTSLTSIQKILGEEIISKEAETEQLPDETNETE